MVLLLRGCAADGTDPPAAPGGRAVFLRGRDGWWGRRRPTRSGCGARRRFACVTRGNSEVWVWAGRAPSVSAGHHRTVAVGVGRQSAARGGLEEGAAEAVGHRFGPRRGPGGARAVPGRHAVDAREVAGAFPGQGLHRPALVEHRIGGPAAAGPARTVSISASRSVAASRRVRTAPIFSLGPGSPAALSSLSSGPWIGRPGACRPKSAASTSSARAGACRGSSLTSVHRFAPLPGVVGLSPVVPFVPLPRTARQKKSAQSARDFSLAGHLGGGGREGERGRRGKGRVT